MSAALLALSALALLLLPPPPGSALPPGLLEELRQRRRDLRRLAAAGGTAAEGGLRCGDVRRAAGTAPVLGSGFTKVVVRAALAGGGAVALKSVHGAGREVRQCEQRYGEPAGCRRLAAYKLLKEVTLLRRLRHPGIVQVRRGRGCRRRGGTGRDGTGRDGAADGRSSLQLHGQCYDSGGEPEAGVTAVLELGAPLEMIQLLQTPWEERFKVRKQNPAGASVGFQSSKRVNVRSARRPLGGRGCQS